LTQSEFGLYSVHEASMRAVRISEDIVPVSEFKAQAAECLRRIADSGQPLVITQNGKAAGVLLSPREFDRLTEQAKFVAAVTEGIADADAGRHRSQAEVVEAMRARRGGGRGR
jgi:prevent-host-death family protein